MLQVVMMNVSLGPELEALIRRKVEMGRYASASEVLREALSLLDQRDRAREWYAADIREKITAGMASLRAGGGVDGEAVFDRLDAELDASERHDAA
jgi:antitoxin ParD1/3/4